MTYSIHILVQLVTNSWPIPTNELSTTRTPDKNWSKKPLA